MEMILVMCTSCCFAVFLLLTASAASAELHGHQEVQAFHDLVKEQKLDFTVLPRKLMLNEKVEGNEDEGLVSYKEQKEALPGGSHKKGEEEKEVVMHALPIAAKGTRQEWIEGSDPTHFFTMDYSHVRRRLPIHNKSFPTTTTTATSP